MLSKNKNKNKKRLRGAEVGNRPGSAAAAAAAMPNKSPKQKLALLVGLAAPADPPPFVRSPRTFDDGAIGLGIVAAMSGGDAVAAPPPPPPARSEPIPIVSPRPAVARPKGAGWEEEEEEEEEEEGELSESYTCVISHVGGRKRVYFDDGIDGNSGVFFQSPPLPAPPPPAADFLSHCCLCGKKLHGLDIFMYGGDKAFCSMECRCQQILSDEQWDKCSSEALKPFESYVSPCSAPLLFAAGVAAA